MIAVLLAFALPATIQDDPLSCFVLLPGATPGANVCPRTYSMHPGHNARSCAALCLADEACDAFAMGRTGDRISTDCRTSHACPKPTHHITAYDGYLRLSTAGCRGPGPLPPFAFHSTAGLFADGMILQRGSSTKVWGEGAKPRSTVTVAIASTASVATATAATDGTWLVVLPPVSATESTTLTATNGASTAVVHDVAFGDVLLCGGQSNMGFGMCGTQSKNQTPSQALESLTPLRVFFQAGSGPAGGAGGHGCAVSVHGKTVHSITPARRWIKSNSTNAGGFSAVCMLTAQRLHAALQGRVPVGAVESCISGTPVGAWTPSNSSGTTGGGILWQQYMVPLLPMTFKAAIWDQGEADAKRTSSRYYSHEFPQMIALWRRYFTSAASLRRDMAMETSPPPFPFVYVELCVEYGAEAPKEADFWYAQRAAVAEDPSVGFAVTTDIQRALHPPDKQDVAGRVVLELRRLAYGEAVVSRGPELISSTPLRAGGAVVLHFSNSSLAVRAGIFVGNLAECAQRTGASSMVVAAGTRRSLNYTMRANTVIVECPPGVAAVHVNADVATCFLYGPSGLPAPPVVASCSKDMLVTK